MGARRRYVWGGGDPAPEPLAPDHVSNHDHIPPAPGAPGPDAHHPYNAANTSAAARSPDRTAPFDERPTLPGGDLLDRTHQHIDHVHPSVTTFMVRPCAWCRNRAG